MSPTVTGRISPGKARAIQNFGQKPANIGFSRPQSYEGDAKAQGVAVLPGARKVSTKLRNASIVGLITAVALAILAIALIKVSIAATIGLAVAAGVMILVSTGAGVKYQVDRKNFDYRINRRVRAPAQRNWPIRRHVRQRAAEEERGSHRQTAETQT